ncbi:quinone-dependent dihydroorotate dehydrogenase [Arhodomonas sp. AD133]|uniref:quinone-dependent dihydroorotate dehydrogenase n=1 Tax=Arhodomonas sp. AD133 TaxID=3415009 RepID=UPI003EC005C8
MYPLIRRLLFRLEPETAHGVTLRGLRVAERVRVLSTLMPRVSASPVEVMGLKFPNAVGLSAGLDKDGDYIDALGALGFGFIEVGTVTPRPQAGNPRPRLFRLVRECALINRLGFNNKGVDYLVSRVAQRRYSGVLGINIGKNRDTPLERAVDDYGYCLDRVYAHADYVVVNVSSPNTPGLRELQHGEQLDALLGPLKDRQHRLAEHHGRYVPLVVKVAPDMDDEEIALMAERILAHGIDGVTATNTTLSRTGVEASVHADETGGLSGAPLRGRATAVLGALHAHLGDRVPLIGVGGIGSGEDAVAKTGSGAALVQLYTGLIYRGPVLVRECVEALAHEGASSPVADPDGPSPHGRG